MSLIEPAGDPLTVPDFDDYLNQIARVYDNGQRIRNVFRPAIRDLLYSLDPELQPLHDPLMADAGAPDFVVLRDGIPVGYVSCVDVDADLSPIAGEEKAASLQALGNLLLTNALDFRWYHAGKEQRRARVADVIGGELIPDPEGIARAGALLEAFATATPCGFEPFLTGPALDAAREEAARAHRALNALEDALLADAADPVARARLAGKLSAAYYQAGDWRRAAAVLERALELPLPDVALEAELFANLGAARYRLGEYEAAARALERALEISQDHAEQARLNNKLGAAHHLLGDLDAAHDAYRRALDLHRETGDRRGEASALYNLGGVYEARDDPRTAIACYERAQTLYERAGERDSAARAAARFAHLNHELPADGES